MNKYDGKVTKAHTREENIEGYVQHGIKISNWWVRISASERGYEISIPHPVVTSKTAER